MREEMGRAKDFLLEIGTEELPADYVRQALPQLFSLMEEGLKGVRLSFGRTQVFATANRLIVCVRGLSPAQQLQREKIAGPSKENAFDAAGKPTAACLGFLRSKAAKLEDLKVEATPRGEYVFIERAKESGPAKAVLAELAPAGIGALKFPKTMRWEGSGVRFARPVRWILALYGPQVVNFKFGGLNSSNSTRIPRYLNALMPEAKVISVDDYFGKLKKYKLSPDQEERRDKIRAILKARAKAAGAADNFSGELIEAVTYLVESPAGFVGNFNKEYLRLPAAVLESSMAKNQKLFLLRDETGRAVERFVAIINGAHKDTKVIRAAYEAILDAKLKDSAFFMKQDLKLPLRDRVGALKGVIFQTKLGTVYERVLRLERLCGYIAGELSWSEDKKAKAVRAAHLSKADLTTQMVKEYPELQGTIGREYAQRRSRDIEDRDKDVCNAIYEHYLPRTATDPLPSSDIGGILAIADKIDLIAGFFAIGLIPTGSEDPFGIRRASLGLLKIMLERRLPFSLERLLDEACAAYGDKVLRDWGSVKPQIIAFQRERLRNILLERDYRGDIIDAVLESGFDRFDRLQGRLGDVSSMVKSRYFLEAAKVVERTANILKAEKDLKCTAETVKAEYFRESLERELWEIYGNCVPKFEEALGRGDYDGATKIYAEAFYKPIHVFFEKVKVNVDEEQLRRNRLALMKAVNSVYVDKIADLSKIKLQ